MKKGKKKGGKSPVFGNLGKEGRGRSAKKILLHLTKRNAKKSENDLGPENGSRVSQGRETCRSKRRRKCEVGKGKTRPTVVVSQQGGGRGGGEQVRDKSAEKGQKKDKLREEEKAAAGRFRIRGGGD